jgi:hypothetical protein
MLTDAIWMGCLGIRNEHWGVRGVTSCHGEHGRGLFISGGPGVGIGSVILLAEGAQKVSSNVSFRGQLLVYAINTLLNTIIFQHIMFSS